MPIPSYLTLIGETQGLISAGGCAKESLGNAWLPGHEDEIQVQALSHWVGTPKAHQERVHGPLIIVKALDKTTPLLCNALVAGENLTYCRLDLQRVSTGGQLEPYYSIELEDACIVDLSNYSPDARLPLNAHLGVMETVHITYRQITWSHIDGTYGSDRWREALSRGIPKPPRRRPLAFVPEPAPERHLESSFALDQLTRIAKGITPAEFVMLLVPVFGYDIPATAYLELRQKLLDGSVANPSFEIVDSRTPLGSYDNKTQIIRVTHDTIKRAINGREGAWTLLTLLLHEFGHHIDRLLRVELTQHDPRETPPDFSDDAPGDEGARFAYRMALFDVENSEATPFARYNGPSYRDLTLMVKYPEVQAAIRRTQGVDAEALEVKEDSQEMFGAGRGEHNLARPEGSFGHESLEDILKQAGFYSDDDRKSIYFGNWLRDYSQLLDPAIVRNPNAPKNLAKYLSRDALTQLVDLLATKEFVKLQGANRQAYTVTPAKLGVYRPSQHMDNPKNFAPEPADPKSIDGDFEDWVVPGNPLLDIDPHSSMKNYLRRSVDIMADELNQAVALGNSPDGQRLLGAALHLLEDYFAHSNFVELSLIKVGFNKVLPWTSPAPCRHGLPIVTGMFSSTDALSSLAEPMAKLLFPEQSWEFKATEFGYRSDDEKALLILLNESSDSRYKTLLENYLAARDSWAKVPNHHHVEKLPWAASLPFKGMVAVKNMVLSALLQLIGNSVDDGQTLLVGDPNTNGSTDPSHSQLAKDHDVHPFHSLATMLAKQAVLAVGKAVRLEWRGEPTEDPAHIARAFICHPLDSEWQDELVRTWALANPDNVRRAESATELQHLHELYGKAQLDRIEAFGQQVGEAWNYVQEHYQTLLKADDQVEAP